MDSIQIKKFDRSKLNSISFGNLEGENDDFLKDSFYCTSSITEAVSGNYNYIFSPKGLGKSALYSAIIKGYIPENIFNRKNYSTIGINKAFGLIDSDYLDPSKFNTTEHKKNTSLYWGLYIATELIKDVIENHSDKSNYSEFIKKVQKIESLKNKILYPSSSLIKNLGLQFTFDVGGIKITPKITFSENLEILDVNSLYNDINNFYKTNGLTALILIDRLDNFVKQEQYLVQKNYIQGLVDCIEEIVHFSNIHPILFIRTDLFYNVDIEVEYDKVKARLIELKWDHAEVLMFLTLRLLTNSYIKDNYSQFMKYCIDEAHVKPKEKTISFERYWNKFLKLLRRNERNKILELRRGITFTSAEKFLKLFLPLKIDHLQSLNEDICQWIFTKMKDGNGYVNLRSLVYFFNKLFHEQAMTYKDTNIYDKLNPEVEAIKVDGYYNFSIFLEGTLPIVYEEVRKHELNNINKMLKSRNQQEVFLEIINSAEKIKYFNPKLIKFGKYSMSKDEYSSLLKFLKLLGYCKFVSNEKYEVPILFRSNIDLN